MGNNSLIPDDLADLDGDLITAEPTPFDLDGNDRVVDGDNDRTATVDMGAYETPFARPACVGDIVPDGVVATADLLALLGAWGKNPGHPADLDDDGNVSTSDLLMLLANWGPCK